MTDPNTPPSNTPPAYSAPAYPPPPAGEAASTSGAPAPGKTLGIVALVLAIIPFTQLLGLILGIVALVQSRKAGRKNGIALAAIIVAAVLLVISIIVIVLLIVAGFALAGDLGSQVQACIDNGGTGTITFQGQTLTCEEVLEQSGY